MKTASIATGNIAVAGAGFWRERTAWTRTLWVDRTTHIDTNGSTESLAATRTMTGTQHAHGAIINRLGEYCRHPTIGLGIELTTQERYTIGGAARSTMGTGLTVVSHSYAPTSP
jgi:hypothetical protein